MKTDDEKERDEILENLLKEHPIHDLVKFDELNIQEALTENDFQTVKYKELYHKEIGKLDELQDLLEKLIGTRYEYYRFEDSHEWTKVEIEKFCIPRDPKVLHMKKIIRKQEVRVRFFEMCWKAFDKRAWSMKMFLETLR